MTTTAIYPGTFDPLTRGHEDLVRRACKLFDVVVVGVAESKTKSPFFSLQERTKIAEEVLEHNEAVKVIGFEGLLKDFIRENNGTVVIRGLRAVSDFEYEFQMTGMNFQLNPKIETIFLMSADNNSFISSNLVKEVHKLGGDVSKFVSDNTIKILNNKNT